MKRSNLFFVAFIAMFISACSTTHVEDKSIILNGQIQNPSGDYVTFMVYDIIGDILNDTARLDENGNFYTSFELTACAPLTFYDGKETSQMYVCPGDSLYITLNTDTFDETIHYEGIGAGKNNVLAEYYLKYKDTENEEMINFYSIKDTAIDVYMNLVDQNAEVAVAYFNKVKAAGDLPPQFLSYMETDLYFGRIQNLQFLYYGKSKDTTEEYQSKLRDVGKITLEAANYEDPDILNQKYQVWLSYYVSNQIARKIYEEFEDPDKTVFDSIFYTRLQNILSPEQMQVFLINKADGLAYSYKIDEFDYILPLIDQYVVDTGYKSAVMAKYDEVVRKVSQELPDDAVLHNLDDEELLDLSFDDILSQYKGNVIYLDFWASWCGPCKAEMPNSASLAKKLEEEDVVFLYVSTDKDEDAWKNMIRIMQLHGLHYRLGKNTRTPVFEEFGIRFIPHYVLFDQNGTMVKNNMTRPGDPETEKMIWELLGQVQ